MFVMENKVKKILISAIVIAFSSTFATASDFGTNKYQITKEQTSVTQRTAVNADEDGDTIFTKPQFIPQYEPYMPHVPEVKNNTGTTTADKTVIPTMNISKELRAKYSKITKSDKLIEACEFLKGTAGDFSYRSIFGQNKTSHPITIVFSNFSKDKSISNKDALSSFVGNKYKIRINDKFISAPAAAIAPIIAREALVNKNKTEDDLIEAEQLQVAIWSQILKKNPYLKSSQNVLVKMQNSLLDSTDVSDYSAFLETAQAPKSQQKTVQKQKTKTKSEPPAKPTRAFGKAPKGAPTQIDFDENDKAQSQKVQSEILSFNEDELRERYKKVTSETRIMEALELLKDTRGGVFSHNAILGNNPTHKPIEVQFKDLSELNPKYASFDALGWRKGVKGKRSDKLTIYINQKHFDAPAGAIAALLAHEALHQDEFDSLNEETYAWTMEAFVWTQICDKQPQLEEITHPLVTRENILKKLLEKGEYTNKYIKKSVFSNPSYSTLPVRSPGFEDEI